MYYLFHGRPVHSGSWGFKIQILQNQCKATLGVTVHQWRNCEHINRLGFPGKCSHVCTQRRFRFAVRAGPLLVCNKRRRVKVSACKRERGREKQKVCETRWTMWGGENVFIHDHIQRAVGRGRPVSEQHAWEGLVTQRRRPGLTDMSTHADDTMPLFLRGKKKEFT